MDFEMISEECGEHYIQFIRELSVQCRKNNIVLSVDNYVPQNYNRQYHREEQALWQITSSSWATMRHYGGSPVAGSVASYDFVKAGIENTLADVPAEKVINGVPFFTSLGGDAQDGGGDRGSPGHRRGGVHHERDEYCLRHGGSQVRGRAGRRPDHLGRDDAAELRHMGGERVTYEVWLEDAQSLEPRLKLMKEYGLAGTAAWRLGQETVRHLELIVQYVN